jgi:hypothetical protein
MPSPDHQSVLLGSRQGMNDIADAITRLYENRRRLAAG